MSLQEAIQTVATSACPFELKLHIIYRLLSEAEWRRKSSST